MKRGLSFLMALSLVLVMMAGCGGETAAEGSQGEVSQGGAQEVTDLNLGTAATSGTYYYVGAAIGNTVSKFSDSLEVLVASTAGGVENISLVTNGELDIGMANTDALYDAYNGTGTFESTGAQPIVGLMALYPSVSHMLVRADSGIDSWEDLAGKRVCLGTACYVKGAAAILNAVEQKLGIVPGTITPDGKFSLDSCRCVGACGLAPVMMINNDVYGRLTPDQVGPILDMYK